MRAMTTFGHHETASTGAEAGRTSMPGPAGCLSLAAAPTFGAMALLTAVLDLGAPALCGTAAVLPLNGMTLMYGLMALFHAVPWLRLRAARR
jgi:hypothetical protein